MSSPSTRGKPTGFFVASAVLIVSSLWFAACATGSKSGDLWDPNDTLPDDPDASADGGDAKGFGEPCTIPAECASKQCTPIGVGAGAEKVCTESCSPGSKCPNGAYCAFVSGRNYQCVPDKGSICGACTTDSSCRGAGDKCLESSSGEQYCARDCSWDGVCPADYKCVDLDADEGEGEDAGAPDAADDPDDGGAEDAGEEDASVGDAGAADASTVDAGGGDPSEKRGNKYCVPVNKQGEERGCECGPNRKGATRACSRTSAHGTCWGMQSCNGSAWGSCDARTPEAEVCDGIDNDCDGEIDNAPTEELCPEAHQAEQICEAGKCKLTGCSGGWTNFPPGPVSEGCQCKVIDGIDSNTCATAIPVGSASDSGTGLEIIGTLSSATRENWYVFETADSLAVSRGGSSNYHVSIRIDEPTPNNEFVFEVVRGGTCPAVDWKGQAFSHYDWCADFEDTRDGQSVGQGNCQGPPPLSGGLDHCGRGSSSRYYLRVSRNPSLPQNDFTCRVYKVTVQASGSREDGYDCNAGSVCEPSP